MTAVFNTMYNFFTGSKTQGSYFLLFAVSVFVLYQVNKARNKWFVMYPVALLVLLVGNPLSVWLLSFIFPAAATYEPLTEVLPILIFIPFACAEIISGLKTSRQRYVVGIILILFVSICGNMFGLFKGDTMTEEYRYNSEKKEILSYIEQRDPGMVLANDDIIPYITSYTDNVPVLYGMDLWVPNLDTGIMDGYDDDMYDIHDMMAFPALYMQDIATMGETYDCDIIIVDKFEDASGKEGPYSLALQTDNYLIYDRNP